MAGLHGGLVTAEAGWLGFRRRHPVPLVRIPEADMVENYTNAFLVSALVLVFLALFTIWALWGMLTAVGVSWVAGRLMRPRRPRQAGD